MSKLPRRIFEIYQYAAPAVLLPADALLWLRHYGGNIELAAIAVMVPVVHAYIVPGIGTNVLRVWEFDVRLRLGRFRPHHGFIFGGATALLALPVFWAAPARTWPDVVRAGILMAAVLGALNWWYDAAAIRAGILKVYNQPRADGQGPSAIAADYALWFFGGFGFIYGVGLKLAERNLSTDPDRLHALVFGVSILVLTATLPTLGYIAQSYCRHGHHGCRPIGPQTEG